MKNLVIVNLILVLLPIGCWAQAEPALAFSNNFESDMSGWSQHRWTGGTSISLGLDDTQAYSGKQSLKISKKDAVWGGAFIKVPFTNNTYYQFSCRVKLPEGAPDEPSLNLTLQYLANPGGTRQIAKPFTPRTIKTSNGWTDVKCVFSINEPEGTVIEANGPDNGIIFPTGTTSNCTLYVDDFELRMIPVTKDTKISAQFNEKTIYADKLDGQNDVVFDLGSPVDFARGSVSLWVTPQWYGGEKSDLPIFSLWNSADAGIRLEKGIWQKAIHLQVYSNGWHNIGHAYGEIADWIPGFSHHVAATWSKDELCLYLDGVKKTTILTPLKPDSLPVLQISRFTAGGARTSFSNLVLTDRVLSAEEIDGIRKKQCPVRLMVEIPVRNPRIIYPGESVKLLVKNDGGQSVKTRLTYTVENFTQEVPSVEKKETAEVTIPANGVTTKEIIIAGFGLFQVSAELSSLNGEILSQDSRVFGSGMRAPDLKTVNDSPFGWNAPASQEAAPIAQIGATWCRVEPVREGPWVIVEPEKGKFDWTAMNERVRCFKEVGIHYMPVLGYVPKWASSAPDQEDYGTFAPQNLEDWSNYVYNIVSRYKDTINSWEVWNETNGGVGVWDEKNKALYNGYSQESVLAYFNLHKTAYLAAKKADPNARIIGPCFQGFCFGYLEDLIKLGLLDYTDIISYHVYTTPDSPESFQLEERLTKCVKIVRDAGGTQPIWETEYGYWTPPRNTTAPMTKPDIAKRFAEKDINYRWTGDLWPFHAIDEWTAANYYVRYTLISLACGIEKLFTFDYIPTDFMWQTTDPNNSPYLHTLAYNTMTRQLAGLKFLKKVPAHGDTRYVYLFSDGKRTIATVWTTEASDRIVLNVGGANPEVSDLFGNPMKTSLKNGKLTVSLSGAPQYIEGVSQNIECQKDFLTVECPALITDDRPFTLTVNVENSGDNALAGAIELLLPEGWNVKDNDSKFQLAAGEKKRMEFLIDTHSPNGMYTIKTIAEIPGAEKVINIKKIYKRKPALCHQHRDAVSDGTPLVLSNRSQVVQGLLLEGQAIANAVDPWKGPTDSSATILPGWDKDNFYLTINVVDKSICTKISTPWQGDCLEVFIDEAGTKDSLRPVVDANCSQLFLIPEGDGKIVCFKPEKISNAKISLRKTDNGYRIEAALPWANFPAIKPQEGAVFGFDAILNNADPDPASGEPEHKSSIAWEGVKDDYVDASRYGRIMLTK